MMPEEKTEKPFLRLAYRFLAGTALGAVLVALPLTYGSPIELDGIQIAKVGFVLAGCGLMTMIWGPKLVDAVMEALGKTGL